MNITELQQRAGIITEAMSEDAQLIFSYFGVDNMLDIAKSKNWNKFLNEFNFSRNDVTGFFIDKFYINVLTMDSIETVDMRSHLRVRSNMIIHV